MKDILKMSQKQFMKNKFNETFALKLSKLFTKEFFGVLSNQEIILDKNYQTSDGILNFLSLSHTYNSGSTVEVLITPNVNSRIVNKMYPSGLNFEIAYKTFLVPQVKHLPFHKFSKYDSGVKKLTSLAKSNNLVYSLTNKKHLLNKGFEQFASKFTVDSFKNADTFKNPYFFVMYFSDVSENSLVPTAYLLRDVENLVTLLYRSSKNYTLAPGVVTFNPLNKFEVVPKKLFDDIDS